MSELTAGIYLEVKKSSIGTGVTAKEAEYRNFWMTIKQDGENVDCLLLDDYFNLTGIKEIFPIDDFQNGRLVYIPQGQKKYQTLLKKFEQRLDKAKTKAKTKAARPPQPRPESREEDSTQTRGEASQLDILTGAGKATKKKQPVKAANKWWETPEKDIKPGDIFKRPGKD